MRIRQIKPEFFRDRQMATLTAAQREFYIGLWLESDDSGWLRWDPEQIAADLYPFKGVAQRERQVRDWSAALTTIGKLHQYDCGHAFLPNFTRHQRFSGFAKQIHTFRNEHASRCLPADTRGDPQVPVVERNGTERNGTGGYGGDEVEDGTRALKDAIDMNRKIANDPSASDIARHAARKFLKSVGEAA